MVRPMAWFRPGGRIRACRGGGVLFEVVLGIALFGGAAAFALAAVRSVLHTLDVTRRQQEAIDLARSKIAELEAGLISLADLRTGETADVAGASDSGPHWAFDLKSRRTEFAGLTLIELTVREDHAGPSGNPMSYTLRQLVNLRPGQGEPSDDASGAEAGAPQGDDGGERSR